MAIGSSKLVARLREGADNNSPKTSIKVLLNNNNYDNDNNQSQYSLKWTSSPYTHTHYSNKVLKINVYHIFINVINIYFNPGNTKIRWLNVRNLTELTSKELHLPHHHKAQCQEAVCAEMPGS